MIYYSASLKMGMVSFTIYKPYMIILTSEMEKWDHTKIKYNT